MNKFFIELMNVTIDFNVLSVFMSFESVTDLHYFVGSDRTVCIIC